MATALNALRDLDSQHEKQLADPTYDPAPAIERGIKKTILGLIDVLALTDGHPGRAEYAAQISEMHPDGPDSLVATLETLVLWLQDAREQDVETEGRPAKEAS